ncbi:uroporphyrinogen-III synthase [Pseudarthrobacter sp. S9]|uniref:uroporphyrinogen-III synthase n=1 Tax=Pseudarthrobacter sp. S9 TaxID=3418421 RepID=UPI003D04E204
MGRHSGRSQPDGKHDVSVLAGARVLVARSPDRAGELVSALRGVGAEPLLLPLIDFEVASDQHSLDVAFDALGAGAYSWLVISSVTTVQVLEAKAAERGATLGTWLPGSVQVAAIGPATRRVIESRGICVDLAPTGLQSGTGLVGIWAEGRGSVLLPQADLADPRLRRGLESRGASVQAVTAYRTVDYPADPGRNLPACQPPLEQHEAGPPPAVLTAAEAKREIGAGRLHAVVAASPSAARRIHAELAPLGGCRFVAIGRSTAGEAETLGLTVAAVAEAPTASGLVDAVVRSLAAASFPAPHPPAPHPPVPHRTAPLPPSAEHPAKDRT